jgi:hypothetical protein
VRGEAGAAFCAKTPDPVSGWKELKQSSGRGDIIAKQTPPMSIGRRH